VPTDSDFLDVPSFLAQKLSFGHRGPNISCNPITCEDAAAILLLYLCVRSEKIATFPFYLRIEVACSSVCVGLPFPVNTQLDD
jgi:hypothetical protein